MKIAVLALATLLGLSAAARADDYSGPPGGYGEPQTEVVVQPARQVRGNGAGRGELRREILERFDTNHDGTLSPKERRHAAKALRRMAKRLTREAKLEARAERRAARQAARQGQGRQGNVDIDIDVRP